MCVARCWCRCLLVVVVCCFNCLRLFVVLFGVGCCLLCATCCVKNVATCSLFVVCGLIVDCNVLLSYDVWRLLFVVWYCVLFVACSVAVLAFCRSLSCVPDRLALFVVRCRVLVVIVASVCWSLLGLLSVVCGVLRFVVCCCW